jgi:hypothetical protein
VLRRRAWDLAEQLGWAETYDAEYIALPNGPHTRTTRQLVDSIYRQAGQPQTRLRGTPALLLRALGVVNPTVRELANLQYEFQEPFVVDSNKIPTTLDVHATPLDQALATYRTRPNPASSPPGLRRGAEGRAVSSLGGSAPRSRRAPTWMHRIRRRPPV